MKFRELSIETQRQAPNNARTPGFAFLVRAGYLTRENELTHLGQFTLSHLQKLADKLGDSLITTIDLPILGNASESYFPIVTGSLEVLHCPACKYTERSELAKLAKTALEPEAQLPIEKVSTPACNTIEALADFLGLPKERTVKAMMFSRIPDGRFVFALVRGDMQLSEAKLCGQIGEFRAADASEITKAGAVAGYASPIGLKDAVIIVDDLIPRSPNLAAGANEPGYHLINTNYGRDYTAGLVVDLVKAKPGDKCRDCGASLTLMSAELLTSRREETAVQKNYYNNILLALAESCHDDKGLTLSTPAAPFGIYLMHIPGKELDTHAAAEQLYGSLQKAGISVLFDDRDERPGVKFNDADLLGNPVRITIGERTLKEGMVELKERTAHDSRMVSLEKLTTLPDEKYFWELVNKVPFG